MSDGPGERADAPWPAPEVHRLEQVMGTVVVIDLYTGGEPATAEEYRHLAQARAILHRADAVFSTWKPDSPVSRLRRGEIELGEAPPEVREVLELCAAARDASHGWFDPWAIPGGVDPTGYVKGWAAQRALDALLTSRVTGALVNAAGDIACHGSPVPGAPWRIGVADPASPGRLAAVVDVAGAIATSGTYERGAHLFDPRAGAPASRVASATVTGPELGLADALATALAVGGADALELVESLDSYEAFTIGKDGARTATARFPFAAGTGAGSPGVA